MANNNFCFKCHRKEEGDEGDAFTVNSISFNSKHNTFITAGSDGNYIVWNKDTKSRYKMAKTPCHLPMTNVCFSEDASFFAFACGEDWTKGSEFASKRQNTVKLYVRRTD